MVDDDKVTEAFRKLTATMARLRGPEGCPWDRSRRPRDLRDSVIEEAYELVDALTRGDPEAVREELGDLLLQVVFLARIYEERGDFDLGDVAEGLVRKLVRRHPHVFADGRADTPEEVVRNWERLKARERGHPAPSEQLRSLPRHLPALAEAWMMQRKTARVGFDWPTVKGALDKVREELAEFAEVQTQDQPDRLEEEIGDLLFAAVNVARKAGIHPEIALKQANRKFLKRFAYIERTLAEQGRDPAGVDLDRMDALWEESKRTGD